MPTKDSHLEGLPGVKGWANAPDDEDLGPCASRPATKWLTGLLLKSKTKGMRGFQYAHMGYAACAADNTSFVFRFTEPETWQVTVQGRNLYRIFCYIFHHRLEWIEASDRDFAGEKEPMIRGIAIERVEEKE